MRPFWNLDCLSSEYDNLLLLIADFCHVAGLRYISASPWAWAETSMVQGRGTNLTSLFKYIILWKGNFARYKQSGIVFVTPLCINILTGMELFAWRAYNSWSRLWMDQQHPPWYWDTCYTSSVSSDPTLSFNRSGNQTFSINFMQERRFFNVNKDNWEQSFLWFDSLECRQRQLSQFLESIIESPRNLGHSHFTCSKI